MTAPLPITIGLGITSRGSEDLSRRSFGLAGGSNLYAYVGGNPINLCDPRALGTKYGAIYIEAGGHTVCLCDNLRLCGDNLLGMMFMLGVQMVLRNFPGRCLGLRYECH
jgi:hypothetical protein